MMAKVVGKDESAVHRITCHSCACILEYTKYEVHSIKHSYDYLGGFSVDRGIKCPNCGSNVFTYRVR